MSSDESEQAMSCVNRLHYLGGPKEDDGSCLAKAINAFLGFPFIIPCSSDETLVYCYWAHLMNHVLLDNKELLQRVLSRHGDDKSKILLSLLERDDYFIQSPEIQQKKRAETPSPEIPSPEIQMIIESGYSAERAMYAMHFVNNDILAAFNWLIQHSDEEIPPFKPNCGHEFTTIPLHDFPSISEGIFLAMMISPIVDPCIPLGQPREILSLKIISLGEFMEDVRGETPTYDGNFGAIVLNACKRKQKNFEITKFPHSFCIKFNSQHPKYPRKFFYIYDALEKGINRFDLTVNSPVTKYMPCMDIDYANVPVHERMPLWQREIIVIVKEIVPEGDKVFTNGYNIEQLKKPELETLFNMYHFVNWETNVSEHCDMDQ